jgi:hypothetical protein
MFKLSSVNRCDECGRAQGELLKPDLHAAGATILLAALVHGHSPESPKYKFTTTEDGQPAVTATADVQALLKAKDIEPMPVIPMDRILGLLTVLGMQLNTHYMHLNEFEQCRELASELFSILDYNDEQ